MSLDVSKFQAAFFEESAEHVATMEEGLLELERRPDDLDLLNRIFRAAHSIKGNAGMFGFTALVAFTHLAENLLDGLRTQQVEVTKPIIDLLLESADGVKGLLEAARTTSQPDEALLGPLRERLRASRELRGPGAPTPEPRPEGPKAVAGAAVRRYHVAWTPPPDLFRRGLDPLHIVRGLAALGELVTRVEGVDGLPPLAELDPERCYLSWRFALVSARPQEEVEAVFEFVRDGSTLALTVEPLAATGAAPAAADPADAGRKPLGEILLEEGVVSPEALAGALAQQKRLGEILVEQRVATPQQIAQALEKQQKLTQAPAKKVEASTIRVDTDKIDKLINLVGELIITQSMLSDLAARFEMAKLPVLIERLATLERNTREIQERVMTVRMLPIGTTFQRFPRLVRDLAAKNDKLIQLVLSGEDTEVDKTVIESIGDPLTHLVRNAADHGLESPAERRTAGKPEQGVVRLSAFHEGGSICITVADDGRGLNREKILAKALKLGLIAEADKLADEQVWALVFRPGFSTADQVTDISGRGVGMDVVKRNIESLGGAVSVRTAAGKGTTFTLKLPLTLAIIEGMTVRVGADAYIIPLLSVVESIQPKPSTVRTVVGRGEVVNVRGVYHRVVRLYELFGVTPECTDPTQAILVILEAEGERVAVMVDELVGQQQVVIKSLDRNFRKVGGIAGATILGDGTVGFILDVRGLVELAKAGEPVSA